MKRSLNTPYVRQTDENGKVINPITKDNPYMSMDENREQRRRYLQKQRFFGNGKNIPLTVLKTGKYKRVRQYGVNKKGERKVYENYVLQ